MGRIYLVRHGQASFLLGIASSLRSSQRLLSLAVDYYGVAEGKNIKGISEGRCYEDFEGFCKGQ
jgi:hypothetical protein